MKQMEPQELDAMIEQGPPETFRGPRCPHFVALRQWLPLITSTYAGVKIGDALVPAVYCIDCTRSITADQLRECIRRAVPFDPPPDWNAALSRWTLKWIRRKDAIAMLARSRVRPFAEDTRAIAGSKINRG